MCNRHTLPTHTVKSHSHLLSALCGHEQPEPLVLECPANTHSGKSTDVAKQGIELGEC